MIPLRDRNTSRRTPIVTWSLIGATCFCFLMQIGAGVDGASLMWNRFGVVAPILVAGEGLVTPLTSLFLHAGWIHLISNMWFLFIFGEGVEDFLGRTRFFFFYLVAGIFSMTGQAFAEPTSALPVIGASGAISAVLGGYLVLYPKTRVLTLVPFLIVIQFVELPVFLFVLVWFFVQAASAWFAVSSTGDSPVAWFAHLGGFFAGVIYVKLFVHFSKRHRA